MTFPKESKQLSKGKSNCSDHYISKGTIHNVKTTAQIIASKQHISLRTDIDSSNYWQLFSSLHFLKDQPSIIFRKGIYSDEHVSLGTGIDSLN